jgi:pimeloyl-ACP methyl ester carboxylesterase
MWQVGQALAERGWCATAVDLRGHGVAPRAGTYRIDDFAEDLSKTRPVSGTTWDLVIGHSIGAAASMVAQITALGWASRLVLLDPALTVGPERRDMILAGQLHAHDHITEDDVREQNPHWHPQDIELRVVSNRQASRFALERAVLDNADWDRENQAQALTIPTLIVGGDPKVDSMFTGERAERVVSGNPQINHVVIEGAGHSVHRDRPQQTLDAIFRWLN